MNKYQLNLAYIFNGSECQALGYVFEEAESAEQAIEQAKVNVAKAWNSTVEEIELIGIECRRYE